MSYAAPNEWSAQANAHQAKAQQSIGLSTPDNLAGTRDRVDNLDEAVRSLCERIATARYRLACKVDQLFGMQPETCGIDTDQALPHYIAGWVQKAHEELALLEDQVNRLF